MVHGISMKHFMDDRFPDFDPDATRGIDFYRALAKPGWRSLDGEAWMAFDSGDSEIV
jgi:hypothetical protein